MKKQTGITLIALVITIVVLIILAGVAISLSLGENGILKTSNNAVEKYKIETIREEIELAITNINTEKIVNGEKITLEETLTELEKQETFEEINLEEKTGIRNGYIIKLGYDDKQNVIIIDIQKDTGICLIVKQNPIEYTNNNVEISVEISKNEENAQISNIEVSEGMTKIENNKYSVEKNGEYIIKVNLTNGKTLQKVINITTIDKLPPKEFIPTVTVDILGTVQIEENGEDTEEKEGSSKSGIDHYEYYVIDSQNVKTQYNTNKIEGLAYGTYKVYVIAYDKAKNNTKSTEVEIKVEEWIKISNEEELINIANGLSKNYVLVNDIELTKNWTAIGPFSGKLDGKNHKITQLKSNVGLFNKIESSGKVSNLSIEGVITAPNSNAGILAGTSNGTIENVSTSGTVTSKGQVNVYNHGGLIGNAMGKIIKCSSSANVSGYQQVGGLVGNFNSGTINMSYTTGNVSGYAWVGGLIGINYNSSTITDVYTTGSVKGSAYISGIIGGHNSEAITVKNAYTLSSMQMGNDATIYVYYGDKSITNVYWTPEASGMSSGSGTKVTTLEEMKQQETYKGFDFSSGKVWKMEEYPKLIF